MNNNRITNPNNKEVRDCKSRTTKEGIDCQEIYLYDYFQQKLNYIHNNPVKEEFVYLPENYKYSSVIDYAGGKGILVVEVIE